MGGGRSRRRHVGLEARTLPTLPGYKSRRERSGALLILPLEPGETSSTPGRVCVSWGAEARLRHRKGGGSRDLSICQRTGASGPPLRLRSLSEASGRVVSPPRPSVFPSEKWSWAFLTHPFIRWGSYALGALFEARCLPRNRAYGHSLCCNHWGWGCLFIRLHLCTPSSTC